MITRINEIVDSRINPILVKEMYQSLRNKRFVGVFWMLLLISMVIFTSVYANSVSDFSGGRPDSCGNGMFTGFCVLLGIIIFVIIPLSSFFSLFNEIKNKTLELVQITGLGTKSLVRGALLSAISKVVLIYTFIAPFAVTAYLFGGITILRILTVLTAFFIASVVLCALAVLFGSLASYPVLRPILKICIVILVILSIISPMFLIQILIWTLFSPVSATSFFFSDFFQFIVSAVGLSVILILFINSISTNALTFPQNRSSARQKILALLFITAIFLVTVIISLIQNSAMEWKILSIDQILCCTFLSVLCLVWITDDPHQPLRHTKMLKTKGKVFNLIYRIFINGPGSTLFYFLIGLMLIGFLHVNILIWADPHRTLIRKELLLNPYPITFIYVTYLTAITYGIMCLLPKHYRTVAMRRLVLTIVIIGIFIISLPILAACNGDPEPNVLTALSPFLYLVSLDNNPDIAEIMMNLFPIFVTSYILYIGIAVFHRKRRSIRKNG